MTGFVGGAIARNLLLAGHEVRGLSRSPERAARLFASFEEGRKAVTEGRLSFWEGDVTVPSSLRKAVDGVEAIVQAAQFEGAPVEDPARGLTYDRVDRQGTVNLLEAISQARGTTAPARVAAPQRDRQASPRFLYMSGITVSAGSREPWNRAKWEAEEAIRGSGLAWTIVRSSWAYGPGDKALNRLLGYSDFLPFVPLFGRGTELLTPVFVDDIGRLFVRLVTETDRAKNTLFHLGGPDTVTIDQFLKTALAAMRRHRPLLHIPKPPAKTLALALQHLPGRPLTPDAVEFVSQGGAVTAADRGLIADRFPGFTLTSLHSGLSAYLGQ